jgi:hypothetical protein
MVDAGDDGPFVELRVHGVSGTSAQALLGVKDVGDPVAGDRYVMFVRSPDDAGRPARRWTLEGMSWGRLTSGKIIQATWLLLLPFSLVNLAYWARPWREWGRLSAAYAWLVRILGLSLTATITFMAASASLDLVGWQCAVKHAVECAQVNGWLGFTRGWGAGQIQATAALIPALTVLVLAFLGHRTSLRYEFFRAGPLPTPGDDDPGLFDQDMWRGDVLVGKLRALHVGVGFSTTAAILGHSAEGLNAGGAGDALGVTALGLAAVVIVACAALCRPSLWMRWDPEGRTTFRIIPRLVYGASALAVVLALVAALAGDVPSSRLVGDQGHLPGIIAAGQILVTTQIVVLVALAVVMGVVRVSRGSSFGLPDPQEGVVEDAEPAPRLRLALWGFAGWFLATTAVILGFAYSSGAEYRVSGLLTGSVTKSQCAQCSTFTITVTPAPAFEIAAIATGIFAAVLLLLLAAVWLSVRRQRPGALAQVHADYAGEIAADDLDDDDYRIRRAVEPQAIAASVSLDRLRWILVAASAVGVVSALFSLWDAFGRPGVRHVPVRPGQSYLVSSLTGGAAAPSWVNTVVELLRNVGQWTVTGFAAGLIALGALAWRSETARRLVGVLWDILSFWPRAGHPLAPPCYAERAVPQLTSRLEYLAGPSRSGAGVVLAAHSQGSLLAVAALAQLSERDDVASHVALLTYGAPIRRLYAPVFPRLFWPDRLVLLPEARRWTNLWRHTDPIGETMRPALRFAATVDDTPGDLRLIDPSQLTLVERQSAYAPVYDHVDYYADPLYDQCVERLSQAL